MDPARNKLPLPDGDVSCLGWPGSGPLLLFLHATGFNAETYRGLLAPLGERFHIVACDQRGHGFSTLPTAPRSAKDWIVYRDDLVRILERLKGAPAILAGHSMGATVSLMAAAKRPGLVRGLVLLEPVMVPAVAHVARLLARLRGAKLKLGIADRAEQRRDTFPSLEAALAAYTGKGAFRTWPRETIRDYLEGGLVEDREAQSVRLACKPSWEAATFRGSPFGMARLARRVRCPITLLYGSIGSTCSESEADIFRRVGAHVVKVDGASHFLPMEYPDLVRHEIVRLADAIAHPCRDSSIAVF